MKYDVWDFFKNTIARERERERKGRKEGRRNEERREGGEKGGRETGGKRRKDMINEIGQKKKKSCWK